MNEIFVLDLSRVLAGPVCCRILARYGASVTRIWHSSVRDCDAVLRDTARGKQELELDLKSEQGIEQLHALLERADVLVSAFRPGVMSRLGLGDEELARRYPRLVIARITAFGDACGLRGFDSIVQTMTGMNLANSSTPRPLVFQMLDHATGVLLASAIIATLTSGRRQRIIRCSLVATSIWFKKKFEHDSSGFSRKEIGSNPLASICDIELDRDDLDGQALNHCLKFFV